MLPAAGPDSPLAPAHAAAAPATGATDRGRSRWWWLLALPLLAALLRNYRWQYAAHIEFKEALLTNFALLIPILGLLFWLRAPGPRARALFENRWQLGAFVAVLLIGLAARTYRLDVYPPEDGQLWEESQLGAGGFASSLHTGLDNFFPLPTLTVEAGFDLLGVSMHTLRLPFLLLGIASIGVFFVAARRFFKTYFAAWFATGLFAISAMLAAAARIALETHSPIFTECLALAVVFYACTRRDAASFALAGFAMGLLLIEYFSYKILSVYIGLLLATTLLVRPEPYCNARARLQDWGQILRSLPLLLVTLAVAVAVIMPVLLSDPGQPLMPFIEGLARHRATLVERLSGQSIEQALADAYGRVKMVATFLYIGGGGADLLPVTQGAIDYYTGVLGVVALGYCLLGAWRSPAKLFLVVAIVMTVVLSGALVQNPMRYRLIPLIPLWLLAAGVLVDDVTDWLPRQHRAVVAIGVAALVALAAVNYRNLFVVALGDRDVKLNYYDLNMLIAHEIATLQNQDPSAIVYLLSRREHLAHVNDYFFLYDKGRVRVTNTVEGLKFATGYLVADNEFVEMAAGYRRVKDCRRWHTLLNRDRLVSCRLDDAVEIPPPSD